MEVPNRCYLLALLYVLIPYAASDERHNFCGPGFDTIGFTNPTGDIRLLYGQPLEIYCSLNYDKLLDSNRRYNSSNLYFSYDAEKIDDDYITIVNETTIRLFLDHPPRWRKIFTCSLRNDTEGGSDQMVCLNYVFIGDKPQGVENFKCISRNWESLNCSWVPKPNYITTKYTVSFSLKKTNYKFHYTCPDSTESKNYCAWTASSDPPYRLPYSTYHFIIHGTNRFGEITQNIPIDHYASVIPSKPVNLSVYDSTYESLAISWAVTVPLQNFPPGLNHKIMYQSKYDNIGEWQTVLPDLDPKSNLLKFNITGLKYAHTLYDIRVLMKPPSGDDSRWSEPATVTFHTNATIPGGPPKLGGYEIRNPSVASREVLIYWQQIPKFWENGDNFEYKFTQVLRHTVDGPEIITIEPNLITKTYAQFSSLSYDQHDFAIVSVNNMGQSLSESYISIPDKELGLPEPSHFVKSSYGHGVWELNWKLDPNVTSYRIYWCDNKLDRPYECLGYLNWTDVVIGKDIENETGFNLTLPVEKMYQIALSANSNTSSSGIVWASCTLISGKVFSKLKNIWISKIGSDFMEVNWIFDCVKIHEGFQLHYCPIKDPENTSCKEPEKTMDIKSNAADSHAVIRELKPYTTYSVHFATLKKTLLGRFMLNTTLEAAPDEPPKNLKCKYVTNSSITLFWEQPSSLNGVLRHYILHWNNNSTKIESKSSVIEVILPNLKCFTEYSIRVQACTTACSPNSTTISVKTLTGTPGIIEAPMVRFFNKTEYNMVVKWLPPRDPGGIIEYYDVHVRLSDGSSILKEKHYEARSDKLEIPTRECQASTGPKYYLVEVRAVNIDENGSRLSGPWSVSGEGNCVPGLPNLPMMVFIFAVGILALLAICISVVYVIRYVWVRCKAMQNVGVKLPPQLELSSVFKDKGAIDLQLTAHHVCPPQLIQLDVKDIPPPDQQLLLDKKDKEESLESSTEDCEEGSGDQESSGCGSGHDSVSSSITAGTHISDSGTEADERPSTPDVFGDTPRRKLDSRQRNVSLSGSGGEGYSRLAAAPSSNVGYVTVAAPASRGYISHPPLWSQNPSKGYVTVGPPVNLNSSCD